MPPIAFSDSTTQPTLGTGWWRQNLQARWNKALSHVAEIESRIATHDAALAQSSPLATMDMAALADNLRGVWSAPTTDARLKKRIVRTVVQEILADLDDITAEIVLLVHWVGGVHTELRLPKRRRGQRNATPDDIVEAVRQLALIADDDLIAGTLNRNGLTTGNGNRWTRERVTARSCRRIPVLRPQADGVEPWLNLGNAAKLLGVAPKTLRLAAEAGQVEGIHPLPDGPWIFSRAELARQEAQEIVQRARKNPRHPAGSHSDQQTLFTSVI